MIRKHKSNIPTSYTANISTAVILAAGSGSRMLPITSCIPKCLAEINGIPILGRLIDCLEELNFKKIIIVTGYLENEILDYVNNTSKWLNLQFHFVENSDYAKTNNIYSLWLAKHLINANFLLIESDLVFDSYLLKELLIPDRIAIAEYLDFMKGTSVVLDSNGFVTKFCVDGIKKLSLNHYKTVNIYSFSLSSWEIVKEQLNLQIRNGNTNKFYEIVFSDLTAEGKLSFKGVSFDIGRWYEVDTIEDLKEAEFIFSDHLDYKRVQNYWNNVTPSILGPYMMDGFGFPMRAGQFRFNNECKIVDKFIEHSDPGLSVLDLGSGVGFWTEYFGKRFDKVISIEASVPLYRELSKKFINCSNVKTIHNNVMSVEFNEKFGIVFMGGLLMYLNEPEIEKLFTKILACLAPGGLIICRESTVSGGIINRKNDYQVAYRSPENYRRIFSKNKLIISSDVLNLAYISVQMPCELIKKWKNLVYKKMQFISIVGFLIYWLFRLGYPWFTKFLPQFLKKTGIEFPKLTNHFFLVSSSERA